MPTKSFHKISVEIDLQTHTHAHTCSHTQNVASVYDVSMRELCSYFIQKREIFDTSQSILIPDTVYLKDNIQQNIFMSFQFIKSNSQLVKFHHPLPHTKQTYIYGRERHTNMRHTQVDWITSPSHIMPTSAIV